MCQCCIRPDDPVDFFCPIQDNVKAYIHWLVDEDGGVYGLRSFCLECGHWSTWTPQGDRTDPHDDP